LRLFTDAVVPRSGIPHTEVNHDAEHTAQVSGNIVFRNQTIGDSLPRSHSTRNEPHAAGAWKGKMAWRRSEGEVEDPALFALASWQVELRRRMLSTQGKEQGRWARLVELSYDTLGYLEQNVSPRLALETFLLECRKAS